MAEMKQDTPIRLVISKAVPEIWDQLFLCYRDHLASNRWVDGNNKDGGLICDCEALMTVLLLLKNFPEDLAVSQIKSEQAVCIAHTLNRLFPEQTDITDSFANGLPYADPDAPHWKNVSGPYTESVYMIGNVLYYVSRVLSDRHGTWIGLLSSAGLSVDERLHEEGLKDSLDKCGTAIRDNLYKPVTGKGETTAPGWGYTKTGAASEIILYFTYNSLAFCSLVLEDEDFREENKSLARSVDKYILDVCGFYRKSVLNGIGRSVLNPNDLINEGRLKDNNKGLYNNAYILSALTLMGFKGVDLQGGAHGSAERLEYLDELRTAVLFLSRTVRDKWEWYELTARSSDPNQHVFALIAEHIDDALPLEERPTYDDRTIVPLVLICLSRYAQLSLSERGQRDEDVEEHLQHFFRVLWDSRSATHEYGQLWDKNVNPSIYYTLRAVDALTEVYQYSQAVSDSGGELTCGGDGGSTVASAAGPASAAWLTQAIKLALSEATIYSINLTADQKKKAMEDIKDRVQKQISDQLITEISDRLMTDVRASLDMQISQHVNDVLDRELERHMISSFGRLQVMWKWLCFQHKHLFTGKDVPGVTVELFARFMGSYFDRFNELGHLDEEGLRSMLDQLDARLNHELQAPGAWSEKLPQFMKDKEED